MTSTEIFLSVGTLILSVLLSYIAASVRVHQAEVLRRDRDLLYQAEASLQRLQENLDKFKSLSGTPLYAANELSVLSTGLESLIDRLSHGAISRADGIRVACTIERVMLEARRDHLIPATSSMVLVPSLLEAAESLSAEVVARTKSYQKNKYLRGRFERYCSTITAVRPRAADAIVEHNRIIERILETQAELHARQRDFSDYLGPGAELAYLAAWSADETWLDKLAAATLDPDPSRDPTSKG